MNEPNVELQIRGGQTPARKHVSSGPQRELSRLHKSTALNSMAELAEWPASFLQEHAESGSSLLESKFTSINARTRNSSIEGVTLTQLR